MITHNQALHREYLRSEIWKAVRLKALSHYGSICRACGAHGTDVHHKTYERWGGKELLSDLEVLCRSCHDTKHSILRLNRDRPHKRRQPWLRAVAAYRYLSENQKQEIADKFGLNKVTLFMRIHKHRGVMREMRRKLGVRILELR